MKRYDLRHHFIFCYFKYTENKLLCHMYVHFQKTKRDASASRKLMFLVLHMKRYDSSHNFILCYRKTSVIRWTELHSNNYYDDIPRSHLYKSYRSWSGLSPTTTVFLLKAGANPNIVFEDNTGVFVTPLLQTLTGTMGIYHGQVSRHTTNHCPTSVTNKDTTNNTYCCHLEQRWSNQSVYIRPRLYRYLCVTSNENTTK